jgi:hypothetical protein
MHRLKPKRGLKFAALLWSQRALCLALAVLGLLVSRSALATEDKAYMGEQCEPNESGHATTFSGQDGSIKNVSGSAEDVKCPVMKSVPDNGNFEAFEVSIDRGPTATQVTCKLAVYSSAMLNITTVRPTLSVMATTPNGTGIYVLSLPATSGWPTAWSASSWNYYQLECNVPAGGAIRSYHVREAGNRSDTQKIYASAGCTMLEQQSCGTDYMINGGLQVHPGDGCGSNVEVLCPIITDNKANTTGNDVDVAYVRPSGGPSTGNYLN